MKDSLRSFRFIGKSTVLLTSPITRGIAIELARNELIKEVVLSPTNMKRSSSRVLRALRKVGITLRKKPSFRKRLVKRICFSKNKSRALRNAGVSKSFFYRK